jgi:hypothetical protein
MHLVAPVNPAILSQRVDRIYTILKIYKMHLVAPVNPAILSQSVDRINTILNFKMSC